MTTFDPGASDVFTHDFVARPFSTAFFASRPAATSTDGFDVFVQLVIAAMTTDPSFTTPPSFGAAPRVVRKFAFTSGRLMRSWGRFGPASDGTTAERSRSSVSL